ncbi:hydantoinase B/oxoprolinase family protein [Maritimibacter sp. DP07]|uniref:Hydantoinase B/oxoprolinase family protein n=1 Tax=Maritimibacter harenae TaxID=2606218 RepID=A0A845M5J3_9RHOB|nr:hydantoinase B/oxoprolinase family protein [Maritimibacter harenae]MZR13698.1 hydantoinase B/oxoprolinase family protein [Maritimibacter harenae]
MTDQSPILYEIIRSRLMAITEEMRIALQSVSGSPTVTDASDFFTGLFRPNGDFATMGFQVTYQAPVVGHLIRHINAAPDKYRPGPGDMFLGNDPYVGALHQNDVQMCGPIYAGDRIIAWAGVEAHETDVGGMDFASWSPKARDVRQEGFRVPCMKLIDAGVLREDVLDTILTASRLPDQLGLDIRAFIATINVAQNRIDQLVARYGAEVITGVMERMIDGSEARVRARLADLPDGTFRATDFLEHDGHDNRLYRISVAMTKTGDRLTFDFSGSSPQAPGFVNCTRSGLEGGVAGAMLAMLAYDVPWNEGVLRTAAIEARDGLICTAQFPAPVGAATVEAIWVVSNVAVAAINKMLACSAGHAHRAQAVSSGTMATFNLGGVNQYGEPFGLHLMDPLAGGSGAFADKDGICAGGPINAPMPSIADVERNELVAPLFYLYRRMGHDTGGAGAMRGGRGVEIGLTLGGISEAEALIMTHGAEVPNTAGGFGSWPGATVTQAMVWGGVEAGARATGETESFGPKPGLMRMTDRDLFCVTWQGGGGWGDPLDREPEAVRADIASGAVSPEATLTLFGVGENEDAATTARRRSDMRAARIGRAPSSAEVSGRTRMSIGPNLRVVELDGAYHVVSAAGARLSTDHTRWREGAITVDLTGETGAQRIALHEDLRMTGYYCPLSGQCLAIDVHERDGLPADDIDLALP